MFDFLFLNILSNASLKHLCFKFNFYKHIFLYINTLHSEPVHIQLINLYLITLARFCFDLSGFVMVTVTMLFKLNMLIKKDFFVEKICYNYQYSDLTHGNKYSSECRYNNMSNVNKSQ